MSYQYPDPGGYWDDSRSGGWQATPNTGGYQGSYGGYGAQPPYSDPYAAPPDKTSTIWALVVAIVSTVLCCAYTNIIGIVFAALALGKEDTPTEMDRFTRYAWISNGIHLGLAVLGIIAYILIIVFAASSATYY